MRAQVVAGLLVVMSVSSLEARADDSSPQPASAPVELLPTDHPEKIAAFIFGGVAVVGVGVGTAFGVLSLNDQSSFNAHPTFGAASSGNQEAVVADVCFGAAVIAGVTSVVLFVRGASGDAAVPSQPVRNPTPVHVSFSISPIVSPHGGGAGAVLRF
jgi:hypothetical protein